MPAGTDTRFDVARGLYIALVTTYGKMFTEAKGRGTSLNRNDWVPQQHLEIHDNLMHMRHTFTAHSGKDGPEECGTILAVDYSRKNRTPPRIFTELNQPVTIGLPELKIVEDLLNDLRVKVDAARPAVAL